MGTMWYLEVTSTLGTHPALSVGPLRTMHAGVHSYVLCTLTTMLAALVLPSLTPHTQPHLIAYVRLSFTVQGLCMTHAHKHA